MNGGYQIIDLKNTDNNKYVEGIYEALTNSNGKPILLKNVKISPPSSTPAPTLVLDACFCTATLLSNEHYLLNLGSFIDYGGGNIVSEADFLAAINVSPNDYISFNVRKIETSQ